MDTIEFRLNLATITNGIGAHVNIFINGMNILDILEKGISEDGSSYDEHSELSVESLCNILYYKNHDEFYDDGRITILGCNCGDIDCGPFKVRLEETENSIIWDDFHGHAKPINPLVNKFEFEKNQYNEQTKYLSKLLRSQSVIKTKIYIRRFELEKRQLN